MAFEAVKGESVAALCGGYEELISKFIAVDHVIGEGEKIYQLQINCPPATKQFIEMWNIAHKDGKLNDLVIELERRSLEDQPVEAALFAQRQQQQQSKWTKQKAKPKFNNPRS